MSKTNNNIIEAYTATRDEIIENQSIIPDDPSTVAAILVLAAELNGAHEELRRIAQVLGADELANSKIAQSDVPSNMLALLAALKATTSGPIS